VIARNKPANLTALGDGDAVQLAPELMPVDVHARGCERCVDLLVQFLQLLGGCGCTIGSGHDWVLHCDCLARWIFTSSSGPCVAYAQNPLGAAVI